MSKIKYLDEKIILILFVITLSFQIFLAIKVEHIKPKYDLIKNAPNEKVVNLLSLGDTQFMFRSLAFRLQNSGDVFAGFPPLKNYNYRNLYDWMKLLDKFDSTSNVIPHLASNYYAMNQNKKELIHIINYLQEHVDNNFENKWLWLVQAIMIAKRDLKNNNLALEIAKTLANNSNDDMPIWARQFPAFIYEDMGKSCMAFFIIKNIIDDYEKKDKYLTDFEMKFMQYFITKRLNNLQKEKFNPNKCQNYKNFPKK